MIKCQEKNLVVSGIIFCDNTFLNSFGNNFIFDKKRVLVN